MKQNQSAVAQEALGRARDSLSLTNYPTIFNGFVEKGISPDDIRPRENVFTFHAWRALGRAVKKGEHGVQILTFVPMTRKAADPDTGQEIEKTYRRPKSTTVFHVSQTEAVA